MLSVERKKQILDILLKKRSIKVTELSKLYKVREETIRRDIKQLAKTWDITIVYGGAYINVDTNIQGVKEHPLFLKRKENFDKKHTIAEKAANLIEDGDMIGLNTGSSVEYILDYIGNKNIGILTLNVSIAAKAFMLPNVEVYIPGGKVRSQSGMIVGFSAVDFIKSFSIDKCFFGVSSFCLQRGIMHPAFEEVENNRALLSISRKCYGVSDSSKANTVSLFSMAPLEVIDAFITDEDLPKEYIYYFQENNIQII